MDLQLKSIYGDTKHPAAYGNAEQLFRTFQGPDKKMENVKEWLLGQNANTLHKPIRRKFPRRQVIVGGKDHQWQCDLIDVKSFKNKNINFLLTVVDVFSKYGFVEPVKDKKGSTMITAFSKKNSKSKRKPFKIQSDHGGEFTGKNFQAFLDKHGIDWFSTRNMDTKATVVERFNRTLMTKLSKHMTHIGKSNFSRVLPDLVASYNSRPHHSTGFAPENINENNSERVWTNLYEDNSHSRKMLKASLNEKKLSENTIVRLVKDSKKFQKGYTQGWTDEVFTISKTLKTRPTTYKIQDFMGETIDGTFYKQELQPVKPEVHRIDKILKTRTRRKKREYFVKWTGYPDSANSWVPKDMMIDL